MEYNSYLRIESKKQPGVTYLVHRVSFGRRLELLRKVRDLMQRYEFHAASDDPKDKLEAQMLASEIERLYLEHGLAGIENLQIDGEPATPKLLYESGPEELCREALELVQRQFGLTEEERKNS